MTLFLLTACFNLPWKENEDPGGDVEFDDAVDLVELFPHDGARDAEYVQAGVEEKLFVEEIADDGDRVDWEWRLGDTLVGTLSLSVSDAEGVHVLGWGEGSDAVTTVDPPIALTDSDGTLDPDDPITTDTGGRHWIVSFRGVEDCPVAWGLDWEGCSRVRIDDGDGDDTTGPFFAGDWWLVTRYGPAWMWVTGQDAKWDLSRYDWREDG